MSRPAPTALPAVLALVSGVLMGIGMALPAWAGCGDSLGAGRLLAEGGGQQIAFLPSPAPVPLGRHFALAIVLCPAAGQPMPATLVVHADMPAHRHGMNYRASVTPLGDGPGGPGSNAGREGREGHFRAEGLLFHMAGRWRFIFDLPGAPGQAPQRLVHQIDLQ